MAGTFEIFKGGEGEFYFRYMAANGEPILASEGFTSKENAEQGVAAVRANAPIHAHYDRRQTPSGFTFVVKAVNHRIIGRSETYPTAAARDAGMLSLKTDASAATVDDQT